MRDPFNLHGIAIELIPRDWNLVGDKLVARGQSCHDISLFHRGRDLPNWLMEVVKHSGFYFV